MKRRIKFIVNGCKWFDKVNGNTYHSVRITRCSDSETIACPIEYGYGDQYIQTALDKMVDVGWIPKRYKDNVFLYERENNYPIYSTCQYGTKRECRRHGETQ